ncbi:hypothetical protein V6K52_09610 [Knoellia sp. S7-12]|uniref:hypothetical protein n=1 Tax=Knoellia sp. S7-12 TaxID=3126698 RepID=UPI003366C54F
MTSVETTPAWPIRLLRVATLLLFGGALLVWLVPMSVPVKNLQPFGCGSPSAPMPGNLAKAICSDDVSEARYFAYALLAAAALLLLLSELIVPWLSDLAAVRGLAVVAPLALPLTALSFAALFTPVGTEASDGALIRCGTALNPTTEPFMRGTCGLLPERQKTLAIGGMTLSVLLLAGGCYVASGRPKREEADRLTDDDATGDAVVSVEDGTQTHETRRHRA